MDEPTTPTTAGHTTDGQAIQCWPGTRYGVSVSISGFGWCEGIWDSQDTAVHAVQNYSDAELAQLSHVWRHDGEDRPATMADLAQITKPSSNP